MQKNNLKILFENNEFLVVDKPAGVLVYLPKGARHEETLTDFIAKKITFNQKDERSGIVHRLDRDTSGLLIVAKNNSSEEKLKEIIKKRNIRKKYLALVFGKLEPQQGEINIPLGRGAKDRLKIVPDHAGKQSITKYQVLNYYPNSNMTLVEIDLITGRTHQIRVHFSAIGFPVVGDPKYSKKKSNLDRQFLHAYKLEFKYPDKNGELFKFKSDLPIELDDFLNSLS